MRPIAEFKMNRFFCWWFVISLVVSLGGLASAIYADTLSDVQKRKKLKCGVSQGLPGFSTPDKKGNWKGIDVDFCKALAIAIFGSSKPITYVPTSSKERFTALQSGEIDVLSRNTTYTMSRDVSLGLNFVGVIYYDGQGFMVPKKLGVKSAKELSGASICVNTGTTTELNLADYFRANKMKYKPVVFEKTDEVVSAYGSGRCDVWTTDQSGLYANRIKLKNPDDHMILPEVISKEPLGPVVRHGDDQWADLNRWVLYAIMEAEELGVTSKNVESLRSSKNPAVRRLLGSDDNTLKDFGLKKDWAFKIIKEVGNYQEIFDRNLGNKTTLKIARGINKLWKDQGLHYPMPIR